MMEGCSIILQERNHLNDDNDRNGQMSEIVLQIMLLLALHIELCLHAA